MSKVLHLHVGTHKTGTTYLQKAFSANRDTLLQNGIFYPNTGLGSHWGHLGWAAYFSSTLGSPDRLTEEGLKAALRYPCILLSSENFLSLDREEFQTLRKVFADYRIVVYISLRNWPDYLLALWKTMVMAGTILRFDSFLLRRLSLFTAGTYAATGFTNYHLALETLATVFGKENLTIVDYDSFEETDDIWRTYLGFLGLDETDNLPSETKRANMAMHDFRYDLIRTLNEIDLLRNPDSGPTKDRSGMNFSRRLGTHQNTLKEMLSIFRKKFEALARETAVRCDYPMFEDCNTRINADFADNILGGKPLRLMESGKDVTICELQTSTYLIDPELREAVEHINTELTKE